MLSDACCIQLAERFIPRATNSIRGDIKKRDQNGPVSQGVGVIHYIVEHR